MKILYITTSFEDYLQDQILIGLRGLYGRNVVDYPKKDVLYENCVKAREELYGCGFTVWKNLPDILIDRSNIHDRVQNGQFDIVIFGSIHRQENMFKSLYLKNRGRKIDTKFVFLDGEDECQMFIPALVASGKYFKREQNSVFYRLLVEYINFSIPLIKIRSDSISKEKKFAIHVQCEEAYKIEEVRRNCKKSYAFSDEHLYYEDIAKSKYAITMKKAGWDCMRHYEISANHTVPCFYRLSEKAKHCAPHGLIDMENVLSFDCAAELEDKINRVEKYNIYSKLQKNAFEWSQNNSCEHEARRMIEKVLK